MKCAKDSMKCAKDSIIVLAHMFVDSGISEETKQRVKQGVSLFADGTAPWIIMSSGWAKRPDDTYTPRNSRPAFCERMASYARELGVPENSILTEPYSADTVGEAYFTKELILRPRRFRRNVVVTSGYHVPRANVVFDRVLGPGYQTDFVGVRTPLDTDTVTLAGEEYSLKVFLEQFGEVTLGDSPEIEKLLYELHPLYSAVPPGERKRFYRR